MKDNRLPYHFEISVKTDYIDQDSSPDTHQYVFSYTITIKNKGVLAAKLLTRHWYITDADGKVQEVQGSGVVGQQPHLEPEEEFTYTSGTYLDTPLGFMEGSYQMKADDGTRFDAPIPAFRLAVPNVLH